MKLKVASVGQVVAWADGRNFYRGTVLKRYEKSVLVECEDEKPFNRTVVADKRYVIVDGNVDVVKIAFAKAEKLQTPKKFIKVDPSVEEFIELKLVMKLDDRKIASSWGWSLSQVKIFRENNNITKARLYEERKKNARAVNP